MLISASQCRPWGWSQTRGCSQVWDGPQQHCQEKLKDWRALPGRGLAPLGRGLVGFPGKGPVPGYLFKGLKQESFSRVLFVFKCESHRGMFSSLQWFNTMSMLKTSQVMIGYARPEGSCQGPHREPLLQLVDSLPTKNQTALKHDTEKKYFGWRKNLLENVLNFGISLIHATK